MKRQGLQGVRRGKSVRTTITDAAVPCPLDRVNRQFKADRPNQLWVSDFTYVSTWQGWLYVAFVIDVFARRIVGWRVAGKTGTAHKQENGGYAADKYLASFVGLAPVSAPRLIIAVMIDEPADAAREST